jgi:predicted dehydrogenase
MTNALRAAVVGAGSIGARLDDPETTRPLTHAGGYRAAGFELAALVDTAVAAKAEAERWHCAVYEDFDRMMQAEAPDVVSFAVPASARPDLMRRALSYRPRALIAEKPLAPSLAEAEDIARRCEAARVPVVVNYSRRFVPLWQGLRGTTALAATIRYAKGLRHNGTHALDLCRMLFGECVGSQALDRKFDHWPDDPTVSAFLRFERCPHVFLQALDERCFTLFEVDVIAPTWRIVVDNDGRRARRYELRDGAGIPPGKRLVETGVEDTGGDAAMLNLMRHVRQVVDGALPQSSMQDAIAAQQIAERLAA